MMKSEEKRQLFLGNRTVKAGSVTMDKLSDEVAGKISALESRNEIVMLTQAQYNALQQVDSNVFYFITE